MSSARPLASQDKKNTTDSHLTLMVRKELEATRTGKRHEESNHTDPTDAADDDDDTKRYEECAQLPE